MKQPKPNRPATPPVEPEIQQGNERSIVRDERLKQIIKQHPQRDEPKVDSVDSEEPGETTP